MSRNTSRSSLYKWKVFRKFWVFVPLVDVGRGAGVGVALLGSLSLV